MSASGPSGPLVRLITQVYKPGINLTFMVAMVTKKKLE